MKPKRVLAQLLLVLVGIILLAWGLWVLYTAFRFCTLPVVAWETDRKSRFGATWFIAFFVVLLPVYIYAISTGLQSYRNSGSDGITSPRCRWIAPLGASIMICLLTFITRVAVTAWFSSAMHPPFKNWQGGLVPGISATIALLLAETAVLWSIRHPKQTQPYPTALLLPTVFAVILLAWGMWVTYTAFSNGTLPLAGWKTTSDRAFGLAWLGIFIIVLIPAYLYAISLGILGVLERSERNASAPNYWHLAITLTAMLALITFCARFAVTAWFPEEMHAPCEQFYGGIPAGVIATTILLRATGAYFKIARSFLQTIHNFKLPSQFRAPVFACCTLWQTLFVLNMQFEPRCGRAIQSALLISKLRSNFFSK